MKRWQCTVCGYIHNGDEPPEKCPVCGADKSLFKLMEEETDDATTAPEAAKEAAPGTTVKADKWRCTVCGYIHKGPEPPEQCPVCGADRSKFVPVEEEPEQAEASAAEEAQSAADAPPSSDTTATGASDFRSRIQEMLQNIPYEDIMKMLTKFHGHPIAVHIPNGLLPVAVLFTLLAIMFGSETFAIAARYNIGFVALTMPLVIATGYIDWLNRFNKAMTNVFKVKIACAATVTVLSIIIAIWWITNPELYMSGVGGYGFFFLLNLINLGAAGLAGWYGGKLVFHN